MKLTRPCCSVQIIHETKKKRSITENPLMLCIFKTPPGTFITVLLNVYDGAVPPPLTPITPVPRAGL
jgi:hypothetical protein